MSNGEKKGLHPLAWVAIGCGAIVVIGGILFAVGAGFLIKKGKDVVAEIEANPDRAAAEMIVRLNPDLDLVSTNDEDGTITFFNNKNNEQVTVDYSAIKEGRFEVKNESTGETFSINASESSNDASNVTGGSAGITVKTPQGTTVYGGDVDLDAVPAWVPRNPQAQERTGTFSSTTERGVAGAFTYKTPQSAEALIAFYEQKLEGEGYEVSKQTHSSGDVSGGAVVGRQPASGRLVNVTIQGEGSGSQAMVQYTEEKKDS